MNFTDRFLQVPIRLLSKKEAELLGDDNTESWEAVEKILPTHISRYHETTDSAIDDGEYTQVYFKDGTNIIIYLSIIEFEALLNKHQNT